MTDEIRPIRTEAEYEAALAEVERLWGAGIGTPEGDRLDLLATLIDAWESEHYPMDPPDPVDPIDSRGARRRARALLLSRLERQPPVEAGRSKRDDLYEDER